MPVDQRLDEAYSVLFTSQPLRAPMELLGEPSVELHVASSAKVAYFHMKLCDLADDGTARAPVGRWRDQRLNLGQQRARALDAGKDGRAGRQSGTIPKKQCGRIADFIKTGTRHLEDADLIGRAEAILDRAQDAEMVPTLALEIEDGIDKMLDSFRSGDLAVLRDVPDEDHGGA